LGSGKSLTARVAGSRCLPQRDRRFESGSLQRRVSKLARHHGVEAFVNMSQMAVTQMSITDTTNSPQHKLHC
jgi:hypothetical protein